MILLLTHGLYGILQFYYVFRMPDATQLYIIAIMMDEK